jgi:hypothetical protein
MDPFSGKAETSGNACVDSYLGTRTYFYVTPEVAQLFGLPTGWYFVPYDCTPGCAQNNQSPIPGTNFP